MLWCHEVGLAAVSVHVHVFVSYIKHLRVAVSARMHARRPVLCVCSMVCLGVMCDLLTVGCFLETV